jgi:transposase
VARHVLAGAFKKSADEGGTIVAADEVGFLMNPCLKATWAPAGQTPVVPYRNRHHKKVSALGAITLAPTTGAMDLLIDWYPGSYVRGAEAATFVQRLLKHVPGDGPVDLVWDNLQAHKSPLVKQIATDHPRLRIHYLPPYAPDLNPVEPLWSMTKYHGMANHAIDNLAELEATARRHVARVAGDPTLLAACFKAAGLAVSLSSAQ